MAAVAGNVWTLAIAKQSAKGVAASNNTGYKLKLTSGDIAPQRTTVQLAETDANRQQGDTVVTAEQIQGSPEFYVRPDDFGLLAYLTLGSNADAGTAPNYIHTATAVQNIPYFTCWKNI